MLFTELIVKTKSVKSEFFIELPCYKNSATDALQMSKQDTDL